MIYGPKARLGAHNLPTTYMQLNMSKSTDWISSTGSAIPNASPSQSAATPSFQVRVFMASVERPEVPKWQEETNFSSCMSWQCLVLPKLNSISNFELSNAFFSWKCLSEAIIRNYVLAWRSACLQDSWQLFYGLGINHPSSV